MRSTSRPWIGLIVALILLCGCGGEDREDSGNPGKTDVAAAGDPAAESGNTASAKTPVEPPTTPPATPARKPDRYALLVGCTDYYHQPDYVDLKGPANDTKLVAKLLAEKFGFPKKNLRILSDEAGQTRLRPTRANIRRELQDLAKRVQSGDQVVLFLSGHGTQQPDDDPENPDDPEPDGLDEVFCPADIKSDLVELLTGRIGNGITDDEFRQRIGAIREKGASVCLIVDACHSGTAVRGTERLKQIPPETFFKKEVLEAAAQAATKVRGMGTATSPFELDENSGGLVAIYASQPHEPTIEIPVPPDEADPQWQGLLTYTLVKVLTEADSKITYSELVRRIQAEYVSSGRIGPTPLVEGSDRHREVLGLEQWPERSRLILEEGRFGERKLRAGSLHGLTVGSILAVYPPPGTEKDDEVVGYARIRRAGVAESIVEPCEYEEVPAPAELPLGGRCEVVHLSFGDLRLDVAVDTEAEEPSDGAKADAYIWKGRLEQGAAREGSVFRCVDDPAKADWLVRVLETGKLVLVPAQGWPEAPDEGEAPVFGPIPADDSAEAWLNNRLGRISRAVNLLKVAGKMEEQHRRQWLYHVVSGEERLKVRMLRLEDVDDDQGDPIVWGKDGVRLKAGDLVALGVENPTRYAVDVTLLFIDSGCGIVPLFPPVDTIADNRVDPGGELTIGPMQIEADSLGLEHLVLIALKSRGEPVDFGWLAQDSIERARAAVGVRGEQGLNHPLGELLQQALFATGTQRGMSMAESSDVTVRLLSWHTAK